MQELRLAQTESEEARAGRQISDVMVDLLGTLTEASKIQTGLIQESLNRLRRQTSTVAALRKVLEDERNG